MYSVATTTTTRRRNISAEALAVARLMVDGYSREEAAAGCVMTLPRCMLTLPRCVLTYPGVC